MRVVVATGADEAATEAAAAIASRLASAIGARGGASLALSGGSTGPPLIAALVADRRVDWASVTVRQVDERIAPDGDAARNAGQLAPLVAAGADVRPMPVTVAGLRAGARRYARSLPEPFDVVHLGVGDDGHTASWPPSPHPDAAVADSARAVELVGLFNGWPRMTLTARVVDAARHRVVFVTGVDKASVVADWVRRSQATSTGHPIERVRRAGTVVVLDPGAASELSL